MTSRINNIPEIKYHLNISNAYRKYNLSCACNNFERPLLLYLLTKNPNPFSRHDKELRILFLLTLFIWYFIHRNSRICLSKRYPFDIHILYNLIFWLTRSFVYIQRIYNIHFRFFRYENQAIVHVNYIGYLNVSHSQ